MMEWIVAILVVVIVLLVAYIRGLWAKLAGEEKDACSLSRELESEQLKVYEYKDTLERMQSTQNAITYTIGEHFCEDVATVCSKMWHHGMVMDNVDTGQLVHAIVCKLKSMRTAAEAGNREELVTQLRVFYTEICGSDVNFNAFMRELSSMPSSAANRIHVNVLSRRLG